MMINYAKGGDRLTALDLPEMAKTKKYVLVRTRTGSSMYPAHELLDWRLKNLLSVELFTVSLREETAETEAQGSMKEISR